MPYDPLIFTYTYSTLNPGNVSWDPVLNNLLVSFFNNLGANVFGYVASTGVNAYILIVGSQSGASLSGRLIAGSDFPPSAPAALQYNLFNPLLTGAFVEGEDVLLTILPSGI